MDTWTQEGNKLTKTFTFSNFKEALEFTNEVGAIAEDMGHHPDICLQNYKEVVISTTTHDTGGITEKDHNLILAIENL